MAETRKEVVQVIFLGHFMHEDRTIFLLRKYIPHKVYFIKSTEEYETTLDDKEFRLKLLEKYKKELPPWVAKNAELVNISFFDFNETFPKLLEIFSKEAKAGNEVIINLHGATISTAIAAVYAATLTGAKPFWIQPKRWVFGHSTKGETTLYPEGAKRELLIDIPIKPELPRKPYSDILIYLFKNKGVVTSKLKDIVEKIGLEKLGHVKKSTSGVVKMSKLVHILKEKGFVETKKVGRKLFEIKLTDKGKLVADVLSILE
jgi:hypothetical protein